MKLNARICGSELPIDSGTGLVSPILISLELLLESLFIRYPLIQTLPHQYAQFYFCLIEPASMLGRVVKFQLLQYPSGFGWLKRLVQRCFSSYSDALVCVLRLSITTRISSASG